MPEFRSYEDWDNLKITVEPLGWHQRFRWLPYYVGWRVIFRLKVTKLTANATDLTELRVIQALPGRNPNILSGMSAVPGSDFLENVLAGDTILKSGDVSYVLVKRGLTEGASLVIAEAMHRDRMKMDLFLFVLIPLFAACLAAIVTLLLTGG